MKKQEQKIQIRKEGNQWNIKYWTENVIWLQLTYHLVPNGIRRVKMCCWDETFLANRTPKQARVTLFIVWCFDARGREEGREWRKKEKRPLLWAREGCGRDPSTSWGRQRQRWACIWFWQGWSWRDGQSDYWQPTGECWFTWKVKTFRFARTRRSVRKAGAVKHRKNTHGKYLLLI